MSELTKGRWLSVSFAAFSLFLSAVLCVQASPQTSSPSEAPSRPGPSEGQTSQTYNERLRQLVQQFDAQSSQSSLAAQNYRLGAQDLLQVSVYGAPDLSGEVRVAADGSITLPLVGSVQAAGLTAAELQSAVQERLRQTYMKDPHVDIFVKEMQSHSVSVFGAVEKPGVFQLATAKPLIEVLSMAQGLADDAGDTVIIMHPSSSKAVTSDGPSATATAPPHPSSKTVSLSNADAISDPIEINLKKLLDTGDPRYNVLIYPGDVVKVTRAGVVYVIGEVNKPGGYVLKNNENISVLQAIALAEGEDHTAAGKRARIIRTNAVTGVRTEIPINLNKILDGRTSDPLLQAKDILFVPISAGKAALYRSTEGILSTVSGAAVYRW